MNYNYKLTDFTNNLDIYYNIVYKINLVDMYKDLIKQEMFTYPYLSYEDKTQPIIHATPSVDQELTPITNSKSNIFLSITSSQIYTGIALTAFITIYVFSRHLSKFTQAGSVFENIDLESGNSVDTLAKATGLVVYSALPSASDLIQVAGETISNAIIYYNPNAEQMA